MGELNETTHADISPNGQGRSAESDSAFLAHLQGEDPTEPEQQEQDDDLLDEQADSSESDDLEEEEDDSEHSEQDDEYEEESEFEEEEVEEEDTLYKLKVQGEEVEVPLSELQDSYMRQADYTKKTQALSEQRKQVEYERGLIQEIQSNLNQWQTQQQELVQSEIQDPGAEYWMQLQEADPMRYLVERDTFRESQVRQQESIRQSQLIQQQMRQQQEIQQQQYVQAEQSRLLEVIPEWSDSDVASAEKMKLRDYGLSVGIGEQELSNMTDHRAVLMMYKAQKYDELVARRKNVKPKNQRIAPSKQAPQGRKTQTKLKKAKHQLSRTGSIKDADNAFLQLLNQ